MTAAGVTVGPQPRIPAAERYGVITGDITGLGTVRDLVGGKGAARWKQVINGMHLPGGGWGCVEYVELPPGASCGRHLHAEKEEIYYILAGTARMSVNSEELEVTAGDLVTCPLGTTHGIEAPASGGEPVRFFVVEAAPGLSGPVAPVVRVPMPAQLSACEGYRGGGHGQDTLVAVADLTLYLTGALQRFSLIEIPGGGELGPWQVPAGRAEVLFVAGGTAEVTAAGTRAQGGFGLTVGTSLAATVSIRNPDPANPLRVISTEAAA